MAGMVKTDPPTTMPEVAPMARMFTFSMRPLFLMAILAMKAEKPMARILIGMAVSMPCPSLSAM